LGVTILSRSQKGTDLDITSDYRIAAIVERTEDRMIEGISIKENLKLADRQAIWDAGARFCYCELRENSCVRSVMNDCEYMGIQFGGLWKLRYFPGAGTGDSQAFDFAAALSRLPYATLPPVVELCRDDGVLPETKSFRENLKLFITRFYDHSRGHNVIVKLTRSLAEWLEPDDFLLKHSMERGLWIHEPKGPISIGKFQYWTLRSFAERSVGGTSAQWVQIPATKEQFDNWAHHWGVLRFPVNGGTPPEVIEEPPALTDAEKLAKAKSLASQLMEVLK
jgi:hypothetical protein